MPAPLRSKTPLTVVGSLAASVIALVVGVPLLLMQMLAGRMLFWLVDQFLFPLTAVWSGLRWLMLGPIPALVVAVIDGVAH